MFEQTAHFQMPVIDDSLDNIIYPIKIANKIPSNDVLTHVYQNKQS